MKNNKFIAILLALALFVSAAFVGISLSANAADTVYLFLHFPEASGAWSTNAVQVPLNEVVYFNQDSVAVDGWIDPVCDFDKLYSHYSYDTALSEMDCNSVPSSMGSALPTERAFTSSMDVYIFNPSGGDIPVNPPQSSYNLTVYTPDGAGSWASNSVRVPANMVTYINYDNITVDGWTDPLYTFDKMYVGYSYDSSLYNENSDNLGSYYWEELPTEKQFTADASIFLYGRSAGSINLKVVAPNNGVWETIFDGTIGKGLYYFNAGDVVFEGVSSILEDIRLMDMTNITFDASILSLSPDDDLSAYVGNTIPYEIAFTEDGQSITAVYFNNSYIYKPATPTVTLSPDGVAQWNVIDNVHSYQVKVNDDVVLNNYRYTSLDLYEYLDDAGSYFVSVRAVERKGGEFFYSDWSNQVFYQALPPVINRFEIVDGTLYYDFSGLRAVGALERSGLVVRDGIEVGAYNQDLSELPGGLYGFKLTAENKYGKISSQTLDFYVGFQGDTNGTFYSIGQMMNGIVGMLKDIQFFGMSLWMMLCSAFLITVIVPFLCLIVIPSRGAPGIIPRGGNGKKPKEESKPKNDGSAHSPHGDNVRANMQHYERGDK